MSVITSYSRDFRHTWQLYVNGISQDQKPIVKISGGFQISGEISFPGNHA